jgi:hypothetical protein
MAKATHTTATAKKADFKSVDSLVLTNIVSAFKPEEIGLSAAWNEFYLACQAADASHEFLRAIHDIKETIEDAEQC